MTDADPFIVEGDDQYTVDRTAQRHAVCACLDGLHRTNRDPWDMYGSPSQVAMVADRQGAHVAVEYAYYFVGRAVTA